jgi:pimeloyl-ACP methyl ester carboxylesterase
MSVLHRSFVESLESRQLLSGSPLSEVDVSEAQMARVAAAVRVAAPGAAGISGTVSLGNERLPVSLVRTNGKPARLFANRETWVVIHGWQQSPDAAYIDELGDALQARSKRIQVVMLDWSSPADRSLLEAYSWASAVGDWAAGQLEAAGVPTGRINVVGHSLGGFVANEVARNVESGVSRIVALDPATDPFAFTVDYAEHSQYSMAFIASSYSTTPAAFTADSAFRVNVGSFNSIVSHMNVVRLFTTMVERNDSGKPDRISRLFDVKRLSPKVNQPWRTDAYSGGFEGVITGRSSGGDWTPARLVYKSAATGQAVTVRA